MSSGQSPKSSLMQASNRRWGAMMVVVGILLVVLGAVRGNVGLIVLGVIVAIVGPVASTGFNRLWNRYTESRQR